MTISSYSNPQGQCVDVWRDSSGRIVIRETDDPSMVIFTSVANFRAFVLGVQAGEFDHLAEFTAEPCCTTEAPITDAVLRLVHDWGAALPPGRFHGATMGSATVEVTVEEAQVLAGRAYALGRDAQAVTT